MQRGQHLSEARWRDTVSSTPHRWRASVAEDSHDDRRCHLLCAQRFFLAAAFLPPSSVFTLALLSQCEHVQWIKLSQSLWWSKFFKFYGVCEAGVCMLRDVESWRLTHALIEQHERCQ